MASARHSRDDHKKEPTETSVGPGRAYLGDPTDILGYAVTLEQARSLAASEPAAAAELFRELEDRLDADGFEIRAREMRAARRDAHQAAGQVGEALDAAIDLILAIYADGDLHPGASRLPKYFGSDDEPLSRVIGAIAGWFESGYELGSAVDDMAVLLANGTPRALALLLIIAEQVIADDDPRDDPERLFGLIVEYLPNANGLERVRLECCAADLNVRLGQVPETAYRDVTRRALGGYIGADQAAFVHRRRGRALAATDPDEAIESYRRAVLDAAECSLGGDVRAALRSISFLLDRPGGDQSMRAARSVADRSRLIDGVDRIVIDALESLSDDKLPQALRSCHDWLRRERINGALLDEVIALRRYGAVYVKAGEPAHGLRALIRAGAKKAAKSAAAEAGRSYFDLQPYLEPRQLAIVHDAAAACLARQADYVPDGDVDSLSTRLEALVGSIGTEQLLKSDTSISAPIQGDQLTIDDQQGDRGDATERSCARWPRAGPSSTR